MLSKRLATDEEVQNTLASNAEIWNLKNPNFQISLDEWKQKLKLSEQDGYKNEVCECGCVFLAFHHYTTCKKEGCPFSTGESLLKIFFGGEDYYE